MTESPLRLSARDFDAYLPERATSNAFSRPRIELKQRALAWARGIVVRLSELDLRVELTGSDETPSLANKKRVDSQWVFFRRELRDREELDRLLSHNRPIAAEIDDPSALKRHVLSGFRLDARSVCVCVALHPEATIDVDNLRARLRDEAGSAQLVAALERLPEQFQVCIGEGGAEGGGGPASLVVTEATQQALVALLDQAIAAAQPLCVGWWVSRDLGLGHADELGDQLEDALVALAPIYRLLCWSRDNDHVALEARLEGAERERAQAHAAAFAETERWRAEREAERTESAERARQRQQRRREDTPRDARGGARPTLGTLFKGGSRERAGAGPARPPAKAGDAPRTREAAAAEPQLAEDTGAVAKPIAAGATFDKGSRVRVLSGPFAHKLGVVSELDGRGGARVLLGLLSTRLDLEDLELATNRRDRPALQSSHRSAPRKAR